MPTYDYQCNACGHKFELFQQMSDPVKRKCPKCGKPKLERLIGTGAGVLFKGGGFYETDYRSDSYTKAAEAEKKSAEAKPADTKPGEANAPAKSEAKSDAAATGGEKSSSSEGTSKASPRRSTAGRARSNKSSKKTRRS